MSFNISSRENWPPCRCRYFMYRGAYKIMEKSSSRKNENTGDGYHLGLKAGCQLIDMEMVQFHPSGMLLQEDRRGLSYRKRRGWC